MPVKLHCDQSLGAKLYFPQYTESLVKVHFWNYFNILRQFQIRMIQILKLFP